ncbi:MAG: hypothetical protein HY805_04655 [Nitrospirae bacterium]|nr:hypothetical protein [Nitrospirota bacterium]
MEPYQRTLESKHIDKNTKRILKRQYETLNPSELKRTISGLYVRLTGVATSKIKAKKEKGKAQRVLSPSGGLLCLEYYL